jgi:formate hydrogenlyase transcriptional activator
MERWRNFVKSEISLVNDEISSDSGAMSTTAEPGLGFASTAGLLLEMAHERSLEALLRRIVSGLTAQPAVALARIWLIEPGDICPECPMRDECPQRVPCLHLAASAGTPNAAGNADWSRVDGDFRRFPLRAGARKVGHVAATGEPVIVESIARDGSWIARPEWAQEEGIQGFGGQPLVYRGEPLGVLGVFTRNAFRVDALDWLRLVADHAAAAIANARAFAEIERLRRQLELENTYLREEVAGAQAFGEIVGESPALRTVEEQIELVAPTDASVLVLGESGTGKELVAREIHRRSSRSEGPLIKVNCASIPGELYESEFFGHVRGAFTGAVNDRVGRFEAASGGTLLLDEVGEIPLGLQSKLLRVLQEGQYERVGEDRTRSVDVRVIAATHRDLRSEVSARRFREDLFYRLNVFPIEVPPLRERLSDLPSLATHFVLAAGERLRCPAPRLTRANLAQLQSYDWPGNVRELVNVIERAVITARGGRMRFDLPAVGASPGTAQPEEIEAADGGAVLPQAELERRDRANTRAALERCGWKISGEGGAAELLGLPPTTLRSRVQKMGLERPPRR